MSDRIIKHEIKLQPSLIVILFIFAVSVCIYAISPVVSAKKANAAFGAGSDMIAASDGVVWQLKDGKVRACFTNECARWHK